MDDPQFRQSVNSLFGPPLAGGNQITSLQNGEQIFPSMLDAIRSAKKTINLETFIYWSGDISRQFTDGLCDRAANGVKVKVLLDWLGSDKIDQQYVKQMKAVGIEVVRYHPLHWYDVRTAQKLNNRTHRKLLIIDGTVAFTGGVGIADEWAGNADSPKHWRDSHYRLEGPAVGQLQAAFMDNWMKTTGQVLHGDDYFPAIPSKGDVYAQVFQSSSEGGSQSMQLMYLFSIAAARKTVRLGTAYFVPDDLTIESILAARRRGVQVQIILPGPITDEQLVRSASRSRWGRLLEGGVEFYEFQPTMYHTKIMIVDELWVSIGSANLDNRSFRLNDEANLNILDARFAANETQIYERDKERSRRITLEEWQHRPFFEKLMENAASIFGPLL